MFKIGDRVRVIGNDTMDGELDRTGQTGTIDSVDTSFDMPITVMLDSGATLGFYPSELEKIDA